MKISCNLLLIIMSFVLTLNLCIAQNKSILKLENLKCEYQISPKGIEKNQPFLSWEIKASPKRNMSQNSYRIILAESNVEPSKNTIFFWDSGVVSSSKSVNVKYNGKPLQSAKKYYWRVQIRDNEGSKSEFSEWTSFETGILNEEDWISKWVYTPTNKSSNYPFIKHDFLIQNIPNFVPAYIASIGFHELYINGKKVSDAVLSPSVSDLRNRVLYSSYDIAPYLKKGVNNIVIWLASGWAKFKDGNPRASFNVDKSPLCRAQFKINKDWYATDKNWKFSSSNTSHLGGWQNSNFGGDFIDDSGRNIMWTQDTNNEKFWTNVNEVKFNLKLSSDFIEPNSMTKKRSAIAVKKLTEGKYQFTMDKIYTGWIETLLKGKPGQEIRISASSWSDKEEEFNQRNTIVIDESGKAIFCNRFTYHQVKYITISGIDYQPKLADVRGYQITNDRARIGDFECSSDLLNKIYNYTCYTYESLSTGGMTVDCPHRERLGYGGDGHGSLEIALDAFASHSFFTKWAQDWVDIQDKNGRINHTAPTLGGGGGPAWSGFILTMPWDVYLNYGDIRILETTFSAAQKWLSYLEKNENDKGLLDIVSPGDWEYSGDKKWLFLGDWANPGKDEGSYTPEAALFNNCYYVYVLKIAANIAEILNMREEVLKYKAKAKKISDLVNHNFYNSDNNTYIDSRQTHLVLPLIAGVVPENDISKVVDKLKEEILISQDGHFDTGIHGTYFLVKYLTENNHQNLLYTLTSQTTYPSYGEIIERGEITWPEYWNQCNSRVHGCLNGIGGWFQRGILGIQPDSKKVGYNNFIIKPAFHDSLQWAKGHHISAYGNINVSWKKTNKIYTLGLTVPFNTTATLFIPAKAVSEIWENNKPIIISEEIQLLRFQDNIAKLKLGSGTYMFNVNFTQ
jgi:alpha-L-rhamnosidase